VVVDKNRVVVFRNQSLFVGESKKSIVESAKGYIEKVLKLRVPLDGLEAVVFVREQKDQFTGNLMYSNLAEEVLGNGQTNQVVEIHEVGGFEEIRAKEDMKLK
jgi:hypothetical protein